MVRFTWVLAALACAILGALSLASCESDSPPGPTTDDQSDPACLGEKADDPSCQIAPLQSDPADTTEGSQPDMEQPAPPPDCSESELPYPTGMWIKCNTAPRCQIEWHNDPKWGCVASCWEVPNSPPPALEDYTPELFGWITICQPSP